METSSDPVVVRERQWIYLGPIAAAPLAHIAVTFYRSAKTVQQKQLLLGIGIIGSTVMTVGMRLWLMSHAGYPGMESTELARSRMKNVASLAEKAEIEKPSASKQINEIIRGFG